MLVPKRGVVKVARCLHATLITYIRTDRLTVQKNKTKQKNIQLIRCCHLKTSPNCLDP